MFILFKSSGAMYKYRSFILTSKTKYLKYRDWLIDFNSMSTHLGLFYDKQLGNQIHCMFINRCFVQMFL